MERKINTALKELGTPDMIFMTKLLAHELAMAA